MSLCESLQRNLSYNSSFSAWAAFSDPEQDISDPKEASEVFYMPSEAHAWSSDLTWVHDAPHKHFQPLKGPSCHDACDHSDLARVGPRA